MERIEQLFRSRNKRALLIPFLAAGDPNMDDSLRAFQSVLESGADIVEIGIPYSDPLADGPVIQAAALRSLNAGFSLPRAFELTATLRQKTDKGLVLFTYVNPLLQYGFDAFFKDARDAGADGVIVPDLPYEESAVVRHAADAAGVSLIPLVAPTSGAERVAAIAKDARGFVYVVSSLGVTGERARMSDRVEGLVAAVKAETDLPVAVGFGVSTPEQATAIARYADGVIVGSALIRRLETALPSMASDKNAIVKAVSEFTQVLASATT